MEYLLFFMLVKCLEKLNPKAFKFNSRTHTSSKIVKINRDVLVERE